jgi:hypothetical protein
MALRNIGRKSAAVVATIGLGALLVGCSTQPGAGFTGVATTAAPMPMSVTCEPNQRAVVRQAAVNGGLQAQVQCESVGAPVGTTGSYAGTAPIAYAQAPAVQPVAYTVPLENTRLVRTAPVTRTVDAPRQVAYQPARERIVVRQPARSVKKSAIIIGSSAGVGAGIGAAVGGKKGAGIGALVAGGGAALWDQITRRKQ